MARIERSIEVDVPVRTAYNQWTQFEEFPRFMEGVREVRQIDSTHVHWYAEIAGKDKEWDAEITEQIPDQRISWRSVGGAPNGGTVMFEPLGANRTRVNLVLEYDPEGFLENVGDVFGVTSRRVEGDLERFKQFIESRGQETGQWRGEVHAGHTTGASGGATSGYTGASGISSGMGATSSGGSPTPGYASSPSHLSGTQSASGATEVGADGTGARYAGATHERTTAGGPSGQASGASLGSTGSYGATPPGQSSSSLSSGTSHVATPSQHMGSAGASSHSGMEPSTHRGDISGRYGTESSGTTSHAGSHSSHMGMQGERDWSGEDRRREERRKASVTHMPNATTQSSTGVTRHGRTGQSWMPSTSMWDDPMSLVHRMSQEMDQLFDRFLGRPTGMMSRGQGEGNAPALWNPQIEMTQRGDQLVVCADLPGIRKEDVNIEINEGILTLQGERRSETSQEEHGFRRSERSYGRFYRAIPLPEGANPEQAHATMHDGVLEITMPAQQRSRGRRLDIEGTEQGSQLKRAGM